MQKISEKLRERTKSLVTKLSAIYPYGCVFRLLSKHADDRVRVRNETDPRMYTLPIDRACLEYQDDNMHRKL